jgi:hypothetical protein
MKRTKLTATLILTVMIALTGSAQLGNLKSMAKKISGEAEKTIKQSKTENSGNTQQGQQAEPAGEKKASENFINNVTGHEIVKQEEKPSIIFSKTPFDPLQPPAEPVTSFNAGDHIYAVAYFEKTIQELFNAQPTDKLFIETFMYEIKPPLYSYQQPSEQQLTFVNVRVSGSLLQNKYLVLDIAPDPDKTTAYSNPEMVFKEFGKKYDGPVNFCESLSKLQAGKNKLNIVVKCNYEDAAKGIFTMEGSDFGVYKVLSEKLNIAAQSAGVKNATLPKALKKDSVLEGQMLAAIKKSNDWTSGRFDATEILRLVIIDEDWTIRRHELTGAILHRYIRAAIAVKTKDGNCAYYNLVTFQEDYVGGKFQPLKYDGAGDKVMMSCDNVNK